MFPHSKAALADERSFRPVKTPLQNRHYVVLLAVSVMHGIASGLRWPLTWAMSHMLFDYHFGFGKRGLFGAALSYFVQPPYHFSTLATISFLISLGWLLLLLIYAVTADAEFFRVAQLCILFFLSMGFASLVVDVGYFEHLGLLFSLICLLMPNGFVFLCLRSILVAAASLCHEANFLIFGPLIAFDLWLRCFHESVGKRLLKAIALLGPPALLLNYTESTRTACDPLTAQNYFQAKSVDFQVLPSTITTLCRTGVDNFWFMYHAWHWPVQYGLLLLALIVTAPTTAYIVYITGTVLKSSRIDRFAAAVASMSPLSLLFVAGDIVRFVTIIEITSLLVLLMSIRHNTKVGTVDVLSYGRHSVFLCLALFELMTAATFTDGSQPLKFPYPPLITRFMMVLHGDVPFLPDDARR